MQHDPVTVIKVAEQIGLKGWGGECGTAAVAINRVIFGGRGQLVACLNEPFLDRNQYVGHVFVKFGPDCYDMAGRSSMVDMEEWGILPFDDPEYEYKAGRIGLHWSEETASTFEFVEFDNEAEVVQCFPHGDVEDKVALLRRAIDILDGKEGEMAINEAPIGDWQVDPDMDANMASARSQWTGYHQEKDHFSAADIAAMRDPGTLTRAQNAFKRTSATFNFYFWHSDNVDYDRTMDAGAIDPNDKSDVAWMMKRFGPEATARILTMVKPDNITVVFTNNLSDEDKVSIRSPWILAHRVAHTFLGGKKRVEGSWESQNFMKTFIQSVMTYAYDVEYPDREDYYGRIIAKDYDEAYMKLLGQSIATMASARRGKFVNPYEWLHETLAQYLITGRVTLNPLPKELDEHTKMTKDLVKLRKALKLWATFPDRVGKKFEALLQDAKGKVWIV